MYSRPRRFVTAAVAVGLTIALSPVAARANVIIGSVRISSPQGELGGHPLIRIIDQSGLSAPYVSGVTDFAAYTATTTHNSAGTTNSGFTGAHLPPGQFTFDLGAPTTVDGFAFWDVQNPGSVTAMNLYSDTDAIYGNGGETFIGMFNLTGGGFGSPQPSVAQVMGLTSNVNSQFFHIDALGMEGGTSNLYPGIGEFAFRQAAAVIPEPGTLTILSALGLAGALRRRRRRKRQ